MVKIIFSYTPHTLAMPFLCFSYAVDIDVSRPNLAIQINK